MYKLVIDEGTEKAINARDRLGMPDADPPATTSIPNEPNTPAGETDGAEYFAPDTSDEEAEFYADLTSANQDLAPAHKAVDGQDAPDVDAVLANHDFVDVVDALHVLGVNAVVATRFACSLTTNKKTHRTLRRWQDCVCGCCSTAVPEFGRLGGFRHTNSSLRWSTLGFSQKRAPS